jgi:hypothetical protein
MRLPIIRSCLKTFSANCVVIIGLTVAQFFASACGASPAIVPLDSTHPASPQGRAGVLNIVLVGIDGEQSEALPQSESLPQNSQHHHHHQTTGIHNK